MPRGGAVVSPARLEVGAEAVPVTLRLGTAQRHFGVAISTPEQRRGQPVRREPPAVLALSAHAREDRAANDYRRRCARRPGINRLAGLQLDADTPVEGR